MRVLIDTHVFLWFIGEPTRLSTGANRILEFGASTVLISIASIWEISIKSSTGKLDVAGGFSAVERVLPENNIEILPISFLHALANHRLPFHHKDPFDRMNAAQAIVEGVDLISVDDAFDLYFADTEVKRIW